jgi:hypothetical protein
MHTARCTPPASWEEQAQPRYPRICSCAALVFMRGRRFFTSMSGRCARIRKQCENQQSCAGKIGWVVGSDLPPYAASRCPFARAARTTFIALWPGGRSCDRRAVSATAHRNCSCCSSVQSSGSFPAYKRDARREGRGLEVVVMCGDIDFLDSLLVAYAVPDVSDLDRILLMCREE